MNPLRKPRPDSRLKNLHETKQAQIAEILRATSLRAAVAQLQSEGIETSRQALGRFLAWWNERQREENLLKLASKEIQKLRENNPEITTALLSERARQMFMVHAMPMMHHDLEGASELWVKLQRRLSI